MRSSLNTYIAMHAMCFWQESAETAWEPDWSWLWLALLLKLALKPGIWNPMRREISVLIFLSRVRIRQYFFKIGNCLFEWLHYVRLNLFIGILFVDLHIYVRTTHGRYPSIEHNMDVCTNTSFFSICSLAAILVAILLKYNAKNEIQCHKTNIWQAPKQKTLWPKFWLLYWKLPFFSCILLTKCCIWKKKHWRGAVLIVFEKLNRARFSPNCTQNHTITSCQLRFICRNN